jgi:hypothetical protein
MRVKIEYGNNAGRGDVSIEKTEIISTEKTLYQLYCELKKKYIRMYEVEGDPNNSAEDYLNEYSEISNEYGEFYIGFEEGEYIGGWKLV